MKMNGDHNRVEEFKWLTDNGWRYSGNWVALVGGTLLGKAKTLEELRDLISSSYPEVNPLFYRLHNDYRPE